MIGLSLSFCVRDILSGKVDINQVDKIIAGTSAAIGTDDWNTLIDRYVGTYWAEFSGTSIRKVLDSLTIVQPRLDNPRHYPMIYGGHWVNNESDIVWSDNDV